ncbi:cbb3-type cytochrome c oxidase subunit 3 [Xinfangfangia sp. CPCC 101601]|uniref:Cbb3-type cytochrome c oxidase subunit 3 n=1 Tax=Pseudogemmobacter lacusdianii TaxID=3069608 RepID=A0ABU0VYG5_9RHOB|nr:cbb3-type cytochrome c oxidase subunit 3 [Xinfangfangia sp. CPCC 101601]MDQ2065940.1 cbb3-type cytochrome c oxidase subunit 3 [Xinfangfangia sp. CPCC 101601]
MEFYTFLRHLADSWGLLFMTLFFVGSCLWVLRPSSKALHAEAANSIFRDDSAPAEAKPSAGKEA